VPCKQTVGGTKLLSLKVKLADNAESLITLVSQELKIPSNRIKLICGGKVLMPDRTLTEQNVKNFQQIMALEMKVDQDEAKAENEAYDRVYKIRKDAEVLIKNSKNDYFKVRIVNFLIRILLHSYIHKLTARKSKRRSNSPTRSRTYSLNDGSLILREGACST